MMPRPPSSWSLTPPPYKGISLRYLHRLTDGGRPGGGGRSDDGVGHAGTRGGVLSGGAGVRPPQGDVGAEGAVGGGQGGGLVPGAKHSAGPLQAERLQLLAGKGGQAVRDPGLRPDLQQNHNFTIKLTAEPDGSTASCWGEAAALTQNWIPDWALNGPDGEHELQNRLPEAGWTPCVPPAAAESRRGAV